MTESDVAPAPDLERVLPPRVLRLLVELEERGGVGSAARALQMSQPSASRAITAVEAALGFELVRRTRLGSTLTSEGGAIVSAARGVLENYDALVALARSLDVRDATAIRLAASRTVGEHLVPTWLGNLAREMPDLRVVFHVDNSAAVISEVLAGQAPLGFVETPALPAEVEHRELLRDRLIAIAPLDTDVPEMIDLEVLSQLPLVEREPGSGTRAMLDELVPERAEASAQFDSNTAIVQAVVAGVGPAVLSEFAVRDAVLAGKVRALSWAIAPPSRPLRAIWRADVGLSDLGRRVLRVVSAD